MKGWLPLDHLSLLWYAHELIFPLVSHLYRRQHAIIMVSHLCAPLLVLNCHQVLIHFVNFVSCGIKPFEISTYLCLRRYSIIAGKSHHILELGVSAWLSALLKCILSGPFDGFCIELGFLRQAL